ncbi:MAG: 1-pyrroline-5-carboxylate dehydrogenase, partial [bacterium]
MSDAISNVPFPENEPIMSYAPGSPEKDLLKQTLKQMAGQEIEIPVMIGGKEIRTGNLADCRVP